MINKGFCSFDSLFDGLEKYDDNTIVIWKNMKYKLMRSETDFNKRFGGKTLGLEPLNEKFTQPKRNEKCFCGSNKKYKKCCLRRLYV
tara:strand:- start:963 stop:1223 length:261 start_codon:yes stop_codon:yes gene_type:complete